jgi:DNA/RNA endonuclease YhcR with UshA esterase domain
MKSALLFSLATVLSFTAFAQNQTQANKPFTTIGDTVHLIGFVTKVNYSADLTVMNFSRKDSTQSITLNIRSTDRYKFKEAPETAFLNQYVQVKGKVEIYRGKPQMTLHSGQQISILQEAFPPNQPGEPL